MVSPFLYEDGDRFPVLDLIAEFCFKSPGSISFSLGSESDILHVTSDGVSIRGRPGCVFNVIGWLDVHHPCEGHIKAKIRVLLPARYHEWQKMKQVVEQIFSALGIPADETFEVLFVSADQQNSIEQATNRDGMTDRLY